MSSRPSVVINKAVNFPFFVLVAVFISERALVTVPELPGAYATCAWGGGGVKAQTFRSGKGDQ